MTASTVFRAALIALVHSIVVLTVRESRAVGQAVDHASPVPVHVIRESARQVMEHDDYRSVRRRVLEQVPVQDLDRGFLQGMMNSVGSSISDLLSWLMPPGRLPRPAANPPPPTSSGPGTGFWGGIDVARIATIVLVLAIGGVLIWLIARLIKLQQQDPNRGGIPAINETGLELSIPPGEMPANTYESRALQFAQEGNFSAAIRELLLGSMSWIERAGLIRFRRGLTSRDYVRAVSKQNDRRSAYLVTGTAFDLVFFGRRVATAEMFDRCLAAFQGAFHEDAATERQQS